MLDNLKKLRVKLAEMFQLDQSDLDFGIYRILNMKRDEIFNFLDNDLLPQVRSTLDSASSGKSAKLAEELKEAEDNAKSLGMDPDAVPKVQELREELAKHGGGDVASLENEVLSHLASFFGRYYKDGDFISLRRYKEGVYAIPYEGEEVKLYWANHDQYYIKSGEYFQDYVFKLDDGRKVHFKLVEASTEKDNVKEASDKERRFIYQNTFDISDDSQELFLNFTYQPPEKKATQKKLNEDVCKTILEDSELGSWLTGLATPAPTEKNKGRTLLEKHLNTYSARNTFDYFIHKDLYGFLKRELDFYIKNEVLHLDDVENASTEQYSQQLNMVKAVRGISLKIIRFLAQLEDFQKKLWLKKKFVYETNYCITIDRVPEELYPEIAANEAQREEWVKLFAIDEIIGTTGDLLEGDKVAYSNPLTVDFLKDNPFLLLDTKFFDTGLKDKLLASIENLDEECGGNLIHSENLQALMLLKERYKQRIDFTYIDPPYNTGGDGFTYKDNYQHSSWLSMFENKLECLKPLVSDKGVFFASIDDNEVLNMRSILDSTWGASAFESQIIIQSNKRGQTYQQIAKTHEYLMAYSTGDDSEFNELPKQIADNALRDENGPYELWELRNRNPKFGKHNRPNLYYPIYVAANNLSPEGYASVSLIRTEEFCIESFPKNSTGEDSCWRWGQDKFNNSVIDGSQNTLIGKQKRDGGWNIYEKARKSSTKAKTIWNETEVISEQGTVEVGNLGFTEFGFPKPSALIKKTLQIGSDKNSIALDFFAGSGTTGHAIINLNREEESFRKYILVEMGDYFDTVTKPRIQKVVYSKDWKDGKPTNPDTGISHCFKYIRLESYEDTLDNLELKRDEEKDSLLSGNDNFREEYMLGYMLDLEAEGSASLLNIDEFADPFNYKLKIRQGDELKETTVDLLETFNWLIGLQVSHIDMPQTLSAEFKDDEYGKLQVKDRLKLQADGKWIIRKVEGVDPDNKRVLVLWRNLTANIDEDNAVLDAWFEKNALSTRDTEFDIVYVNGDNNLPNLRSEDQSWKVRLLEEEFHKRMWEDAK